MRSSYVQADGRIVRLLSKDYEVSDPWDSMITVTLPLDGRSPDARRQRALHVAHAGNYDYVIEKELKGSVVHRLSAQGGEFLVAVSSDPDEQGVGLWRGPHHEVVTFMPRSTDDAAVALRPLMDLAFFDSPEGVIVEPQPSLQATVEVQMSTTYVDQVGEVDVRSAEEGLVLVPSWAGAEISAGEMWRIELGEEGDSDVERALLVVSDSAVLTIHPEDQGKSGIQNAVEYASSITEISVSPRVRS